MKTITTIFLLVLLSYSCGAQRVDPNYADTIAHRPKAFNTIWYHGAEAYQFETSQDSFNFNKPLLVNGVAVGGTPGGSTTMVQFNDDGVLAGDAGMVFNSNTGMLTTTQMKTYAPSSQFSITNSATDAQWIFTAHTGELSIYSSAAGVDLFTVSSTNTENDMLYLVNDEVQINPKIRVDTDQGYGSGTGLWFGDGNTGVYEVSDNLLTIEVESTPVMRVKKDSAMVDYPLWVTKLIFGDGTSMETASSGGSTDLGDLGVISDNYLDNTAYRDGDDFVYLALNPSFADLQYGSSTARSGVSLRTDYSEIAKANLSVVGTYMRLYTDSIAIAFDTPDAPLKTKIKILPDSLAASDLHANFRQVTAEKINPDTIKHGDGWQTTGTTTFESAMASAQFTELNTDELNVGAITISKDDLTAATYTNYDVEGVSMIRCNGNVIFSGFSGGADDQRLEIYSTTTGSTITINTSTGTQQVVYDATITITGYGGCTLTNNLGTWYVINLTQ